MDPVALLYYATICGTLAAFVPQAAGRWGRLGIGVAVGLIAAGALPLARAAFGL